VAQAQHTTEDDPIKAATDAWRRFVACVETLPPEQAAPLWQPVQAVSHLGMSQRTPMKAPKFSLPKQWEDWCNWLLGIWLCISPWALRYDLDLTATKTAVVSGVLIILAQLVKLKPVLRLERSGQDRPNKADQRDHGLPR